MCEHGLSVLWQTETNGSLKPGSKFPVCGKNHVCVTEYDSVKLSTSAFRMPLKLYWQNNISFRISSFKEERLFWAKGQMQQRMSTKTLPRQTAWDEEEFVAQLKVCFFIEFCSGFHRLVGV